MMTLIAYGSSVEFTSPKGGWRDSSNKKIGFTQSVYYPDVRVTTPDNQPDTGLIEGILHNIAAHQKPYTLVVNGNAMPLKVDGSSFKRPYSFGKGSNSVELLSPDRKVGGKMQFYDVSQREFAIRIRAILSWDSDGTDLDLHMITPDGQHCSYSERQVANGTALDVDVTTGYGPEIIGSPGTVKGTYYLLVNYYGRSTTQKITVATITVIINEGSLDEKVETVRVPLRRPGELVQVYTFNYN
jgi:uncharacterized protein YfaP (DUF2135 family)